jgi:SPP1 gp7 family putative phage head morphogenesis protein
MTNQNSWKYKRKNETEIDKAFKDLKNFIGDLFNSANSIEDGISKLDQLSDDPKFDQLSNIAAKNIIMYQANSNARTWREAASKSTQGRRVYEYLKREMNQTQPFNDLIEQSATYIKTLPRDIATRVVKRVSDLTLQGERSGSIADQIRKYFPQASKASETLIARTQVAKTYAAITQTRAQSVGVTYYIWHTVGGPKVRDSHRHMNNVIVFYNEPPSPEELINKKSQGYYHAGGIYNCRCYMEPVLDINDVSWPHKVYHAGKITTMGKAKFRKLLQS